jgi:hypothetical protein
LKNIIKYLNYRRNYHPNNQASTTTGQIPHSFSFLDENFRNNFIQHSNSPDNTLEEFRELLRRKKKKKEKKE